MRYIGIDGGLHGSIAVIDGKKLNVIDMPIFKVEGRCKYDLEEIMRTLISVAEDSFCVLEIAQPFRKQGVTSTFSTGFCYGAMTAFLISLRIPYQPVWPKRWKKEYSLGKDKAESVAMAQKLYPGAPLTGPKGGGKDGRAEALLMADYAKRFYPKG